MLSDTSKWTEMLGIILSLRNPPQIYSSIQTSSFSSMWQKSGNPYHLHRKDNETGKLGALLVVEPLSR